MNPTPPSTSISGAFIARLGAWLQLAQLVGFVGTVTGMRKAFKALGSPSQGDTAELSRAIGDVLAASFTGIALSLVGILLILIAITVCRYRAVWMYWFLCIYGTLIFFSYFMPFGLFFFIYALLKKEEFLRPNQSLPEL
ncbi:MotA/TolQ/ExbB proton channel family protein [Prosthecobacter vanneervenii]|uniref:Drug/metabolite transporter (DMT)-like permease n=1 Tax=Prosthecobacter vanneervenii TaxID=48466 RepID=A0A7W7YG52_9BACT|nr:MotA/TolQ/ExbB proton channel family protein [Prosthecobacter vanneervenii]MBB5035533.1 drug/metabolite transporter (DMT)-like permease [Prosthecobacter vanneervenii]